MKMTHLGHSCVLIDVAGTRLLIDPGTFSDVGDVRGLDAVLVTHTHPDHLDVAAVPTLMRVNDRAQWWMEPGAAQRLHEAQPDLPTPVTALATAQSLRFGDVAVTPVGEQHAFIHDFVPRPNNLGLVITAPGEPTVFHPGDALDADDEALAQVDVLCVPINAPWARVADTITFVRRISPGRVVPIHDGLLSDAGREMYLGHIGSFGAEGGLEVLDLRGAGAVHI